MVQQPDISGLDLPSISVILLSDDVHLCALLQPMLAMSENPVFNTQIIAAAQFTTALTLQADLIIIDRIYNTQPFTQTINTLTSELTSAFLPPILLLLEEKYLTADLSHLADVARAGVNTFLLKSNLSLTAVLTSISQSHPISQQPFSTQANMPANAAIPLVAQTDKHLFASTESSSAIKNTEVTVNVTSSAQEISPEQQTHQLTVDIQNQRVHVSKTSHSEIFSEDTMLDMDQWISMLDIGGASEFQEMLNHACNYQPIPNKIHCRLSSLTGEQLTATISEIQINNNGQGRVMGASAQLVINSSAKTLSKTLAARSGFDNLGDSSKVISDEKVWKKVSHSLPITCLLLDERGHVAKVINSDATSSSALPSIEQGQLLSDILEIETLDNFVEAINRTLNTGKAHQQTITYPGPNGIRWLDTHITILKGDAGLSRQVVWSAIDITATRHAYQELLKNHDTLYDLLDQAPVLFFQKDGSGRYKNANKAFCQLFDVRSDIIAGRNNKEIFNGSTLEHMQKIESDLDENNSSSHTLYNDVIDQSQYQFHWEATQLKSSTSNAIESIIGFGFAIKLPSQENKNSPNSSTVSSLDNKTQNHNAAEIEMSGAVAQDFKTIISGIVNYTEMAMSQKNAGREDKFIEYIDQVINTSNHARTLLTECSVHDGSEDSIQATELKPLITDVVETLRPTLPSQLDFRVELDNSEGKALVCAKAFRKIVMQLLVSARDSSNKTDKREILLTLSNAQLNNSNCDACQEALNGDFIALTVHTKIGSMTDKNHRALIKAAQSATKRKTSDNVVAMTHSSDGHALIQYQNETLSLQMLFPKA